MFESKKSLSGDVEFALSSVETPNNIPTFNFQNDKIEYLNYYKRYGFVVFNIYDIVEHKEKIDRCIELHISTIQKYLEDYHLSDNYVKELNHPNKISSHVNNIKHKKLFPSKLNFGSIGGTQYKHDSPTNVKYDLFPDYETMNDFISQSEIAWLLRYFCFYLYKDLLLNVGIINNNDYLLASIENSTCMFSNLYGLSRLQEDGLRFYPGIISDKRTGKPNQKTYLTIAEKIKYPRGFLSLNDGDSFSIVPGVHKPFYTLIKDMEDSGYSIKRTTTRAVPPIEYNFNPIARNFTNADYRERKIMCIGGKVANCERIFGYTFSTKRRGTDYLITGEYENGVTPFILNEPTGSELFTYSDMEWKLVQSLIYTC